MVRNFCKQVREGPKEDFFDPLETEEAKEKEGKNSKGGEPYTEVEVPPGNLMDQTISELQSWRIQVDDVNEPIANYIGDGDSPCVMSDK